MPLRGVAHEIRDRCFALDVARQLVRHRGVHERWLPGRGVVRLLVPVHHVEFPVISCHVPSSSI